MLESLSSNNSKCKELQQNVRTSHLAGGALRHLSDRNASICPVFCHIGSRKGSLLQTGWGMEEIAGMWAKLHSPGCCPPPPPFHVCNNMWRGRKLPCVLPIKAVLKIECLGRYAQRPTVLGPLSRTRDASALPGRHRGALCAGTSGWWGCGRESSTTALQYFAIHNSICSKRIIRKYNLESVQSVLSQEGAFWLKGMESQHDPLSAE